MIIQQKVIFFLVKIYLMSLIVKRNKIKDFQEFKKFDIIDQRLTSN